MRHTGIDNDFPDHEEGDDRDLLLENILSRAFRKLSDDAQTILSLFSEGFSYMEIADRMNLKNETYARRKKYLSKEALIELVKADPEYKDYLDFR
jgi:DNA-directed RNA polymerase specialized sigma24 family protein